MEDIISINDAGIKRMTIDIYDYLGKINSILLQIDDVMAQSIDNLKVDGSNFVYNKYSLLRDNMEVVKENIMSYADDLLKAKSKFTTLSSDLSSEVIQMAAKTQSDIV